MITPTHPPFSYDLWDRLATEKRDILLYGMGNGADKLLLRLAERNIPVSGVFASNGFVRGHSFHGMRVMSYDEVKEHYAPGECVILLAFGSSRPEVLSLFDAVAERYPLLVPDLPVCGDNLFTAGFYYAHEEEFSAARALFCDEQSRTLFDCVLRCKLTGEYPLFAQAVSDMQAWDILCKHPISSMADFGAYNGDSIREACSHTALSYVLAAEPDRRNFKKLQDYADTQQGCNIECHRVAVCERLGSALFDASGNRNAGLCTGRGNDEVSTSSPDAMLGGRAVDYMKYDVEGAEAAAIAGSADTIRTHRPALRVALYHRPEDMFALPLQIASICPAYEFHLTRLRGCPAWDLDLIAIPPSKRL